MTATIPKPDVLDVQIDGIPDALKERPQWVTWRLEWARGGWSKIPYNPHSGKHASSTDPKTWCALTETIGEYKLEPERWDGVGFVMTGADPFVGVDLDHCVLDGELQRWTDHQRRPWPEGAPEPTAIIEQIDSYAELSPSGTGVRIIGMGKLPPKGRKRGDVELYDRKRYLTITGHRLANVPTTAIDCQTAIDTIHAAFWPAPAASQPAASQPGGNGHAGVADDRVIALLANSDRSRKFDRLFYRGDASEYPTPSEADAALASKLAWATRSPGQIKRLMRQSGLRREKWTRDDYLDRTIASALEFVNDPYDWNTHQGNVKPDGRVEHQPRKFNRTDLGNAQRLADLHGDTIRFCYPWGKWIIWDGQRWRPDDTGAIERKAVEAVKTIWRDASQANDADERKALGSHAAKSEAAGRIAAMVKLAQSLVPILPDKLDTDLWTLNCQNGTIDLKSGKLRPHRRADFLTKVAPVEFDPEAKCVRLDDFLGEVFDGDASLVKFIQRLAGYCLTGSTEEQILPIFYGAGANGKSTLVGALLETLGSDYSMKASADFLLAKRGESHPTALADLAGKRLVACVETDEGRRLDEGLAKELTGSDRIRARRMREDHWEFAPTHKIILGTNHRPVVRGTDHAMWRRVRLVPFRFAIPEPQRDKRLSEKLRVELPGILAWCVRGCLEWQRDGLAPPYEVLAATDSYRQEEDVIGTFLTECCVIEQSATVRAQSLYAAYRRFCEDTGERPRGQRSFGRAMTEREFLRFTNNGACYRGVGLTHAGGE